jgi:hypothetical protein
MVAYKDNVQNLLYLEDIDRGNVFLNKTLIA